MSDSLGVMQGSSGKHVISVSDIRMLRSTSDFGASMCVECGTNLHKKYTHNIPHIQYKIYVLIMSIDSNKKRWHCHGATLMNTFCVSSLILERTWPCKEEWVFITCRIIVGNWAWNLLLLLHIKAIHPHNYLQKRTDSLMSFICRSAICSLTELSVSDLFVFHTCLTCTGYRGI